MKLLCFTDSLGSGGAQRQLVNLAIGFKKKGHEVFFLVYHPEDFFLPLLQENQIPVTVIYHKNYLIRLLKIRAYIRKGNFDGVLSFLEGANFIAEISALPFKKWKLVVGERSANPNILKSFKLKTYRWFHFLADYVVANSHENIKLVKKCNPLLPNSKLKVIYNIVDIDKWKPKAISEVVHSQKLKVIVIANHQSLKNASGLINAVSLLPEKLREKLKIDWYGRQDSFELQDSFINTQKLLKEKKLEKIITFYPPNANIHEIIQNYDVLGLFSLYEGFPNTICEGMAAGKPIVASAVSDVPLIIEEGLNGYLCNPDNPESIVKSLVKTLVTPREQLFAMGKRNREKAEILFSEKETIDKYLIHLQQ